MEYFNKTKETWRLGLCCQFHNKDLANKFNANATTKTSFLKDNSKARVAATRNVDKLKWILEYLAEQPDNFKCYRMTSGMLPVYTLPEAEEFYDGFIGLIIEKLKIAGKVAIANEIRLSMHPGQYTVLGSNNKDVVEKSIKDIEYHCFIGKAMGIPPEDFSVNIHLQGLYGGKHIDGIKRFASNFQYLSDYAQKALSVENEDKPNGYDIEHTLELAQRIPIKCTLDIHHYACHRMRDSEKVKNSEGKVVNRKIRDEVRHLTVNDDYFKEAVKTWKGRRPLFHKSQSFPIDREDYWMKVNAHSDVYYDEELMSLAIPMLEYADFDVEAKNKEQAVVKFWKYIKEEEEMAGESLITKRLQ
tara:strand:- start:14679 stop:15752 length:1074 start_codon:yes stop_codon:yes gene_type:complete